MEHGVFSEFNKAQDGAVNPAPEQAPRKKTKTKAEKRISRRKKLTIAGAGVLAGLTGFSVLASWSDTSDVGTTLNTGKFDVEMSVNGGSWSSTTNKVSLGWQTGSANLVSSSSKLAPGDELKSKVALRLSGDSTHKGKISSIALKSGGSTALDIPWTMKNGTTTIASGSNMANKTVSPNITLNPGSGSNPGAAVTLDMNFTVGDNLAQSATVTPEWTFVSELDN